jgi:carbonic anhydrase
VARSVRLLTQQSHTLERLERDGRLVVVGAMYNLATGEIDFSTDAA